MSALDDPLKRKNANPRTGIQALSLATTKERAHPHAAICGHIDATVWTLCDGGTRSSGAEFGAGLAAAPEQRLEP
jgi:hypothetical protein